MKVLVIEDEHRIAQAIKKGLEQEGYQVDVAYTGTSGLDMGLTDSYDAILLDVLLPEMDGYTVCRFLRKQKNHTPVLMLTAKGQIQERVTGLDCGADDYLTKPFAFEELLARVRALIRRPKQISEQVLSYDDIILHPETFTVMRAQTQISLSRREFSLLEYLLRHPNTTVSKEQIIRHVWEYDTDILPNTVEVYMRNLRKKIDLPFPKSTRLLYTVRGFGYALGKV